MTPRLERLRDALTAVLGGRIGSLAEQHNQLTLTVDAAQYSQVCLALRDASELRFEQLIDLCGIDYSTYGAGGGGEEPAEARQGPRFAAVLHLLSVTHNWRLRVRVPCADDDFPMLDSAIDTWPAANWFEREAFDLFGIVFAGHPDLRRILTDYGFIGHPFRKDFPVSGHVEMRYDPEKQRVIYAPVTIEPREITPRVVRDAHYAGDYAGDK